jgi:hypothetical protein
LLALSIITETVKLSLTAAVDSTGAMRTTAVCVARFVSSRESEGVAITSTGRRARARRMMSHDLTLALSTLARRPSNFTILISYQAFSIIGR